MPAKIILTFPQRQGGESSCPK